MMMTTMMIPGVSGAGGGGGQALLTRTLHVLMVVGLMLVTMTAAMPRRRVARGADSRRFLGDDKIADLLIGTHNFQPLSNIVKREASSAMSDIKSSYKMFYDKLVTFSAEIPSKLKSSAPSELASNAGAMTHIIKPTDDAFEKHNVEAVIKYVMLALMVTEEYLKGVQQCQYVNADDQAWFDGEKQGLDFMITITKMSLANLRLEAENVEVVDPGVGSINAGVYGGLSDGVRSDITALLIALAQGCQQSS